jgi:hypothetical protein
VAVVIAPLLLVPTFVLHVVALVSRTVDAPRAA